MSELMVMTILLVFWVLIGMILTVICCEFINRKVNKLANRLERECDNRVRRDDLRIRQITQLYEITKNLQEKIDNMDAHVSKLQYDYTKIDELCAGKIARLIPKFDDKFVTCETCGCLVAKEIAVKGDSVIKKVEEGFKCIIGEPGMVPNIKEVIREVYYCKAHAPKEKK